MSENNLELLSRSEQRVILPVAPDFSKLIDHQEVIYPEPWTTTLYLGGEDKKFPSSCAIKVRFHSEQQMEDFDMVNPETPCIFEIKIHPKNADASTKRKKFRIDSTVGVVLNALKTRENFAQLDGIKLRGSEETFPVGLLESICNRDHIEGLVPLGASHYYRQHFEGKTDRITVDSHVSFCSTTFYDGNWYLSRQQNFSGVIVETKSTSLQSDQIPGPQRFSKFDQIRLLTMGDTATTFLNPEMIMLPAGNEWQLIEREAKVDTANDNRPALKDWKPGKEAGIHLGPYKENVTPIQFLIINDRTSLCLMGRLGVTKKTAIKYKVPKYTEGGIATARLETVVPYSDDALVNAIRAVGGSPNVDYPRTAYFSRNRVLRPVVCGNSGNVFAITADCCVSEDGRQPLNQIEIEYRGKLRRPNDPDQIDMASVDADFQRITQHLMLHLRRSGLRPNISKVTKYEWAKAPKQNEQKLLVGKQDNFQSGSHHHANMKLVEAADGVWLDKRFNVYGTSLSSDEIVGLYRSYRRQVAACYRIPGIKSVSRISPDTIIAREQLILGGNVKDVMRRGDELEIARVTAQIFLPLKTHLIAPFAISDTQKSDFPIDTMMDIKPDNFILGRDGALYFVDFFPPRFRDAHGKIYPVDVVLDSGKVDRLSYIYGDLVPIMTRYLLSCIRANPIIYQSLTNYLLTLAVNIDPSGLLLQSLKRNAQLPKVVDDYSHTKHGHDVLRRILELEY